MLKDYEVVLGTIGDGLFSILLKVLDWEAVLGTLGDAISTLAARLLV